MLLEQVFVFCVDCNFDSFRVVSFSVVCQFVLSREPVCAVYCDVVVFLDVLRDLFLCDCGVNVENEYVRSLVVVCCLCLSLSAFVCFSEGCVVKVIEEGCCDEVGEMFV